LNLIRLLPVFISALLLGAHFWRGGDFGLAVVSIFAPLLLLIKKKWVLYVTAGLLIAGSAVWLETTIALVNMRQAAGGPWIRLAAILGSVALVTLLSAFVLRGEKLRRRYDKNDSTVKASAAAFFAAAFIMAMAHIQVNIPILLMERFIPGGGWAEIFLLSIYAAWITEKMLDRNVSAVWRRRIWGLFSLVFFAQLVLGLMGFEKFLMTGKLHLPIPALIAAGPLYRWESSIMLFLFLGAVVLVGPAWCSHLCYIGSWDDYAARKRKKPGKLPKWRRTVQAAIAGLVIITAIILRLAGVPTVAATLLAIGFGLAGVAVMIIWSRKTGVMTHCITWCPIGVAATWLGKISPFRIRINDNCSDCGICHLACRYDALNLADIKNRKPSISCTLCGDCIGKCDDSAIGYRFAGLKANHARTLFIILVVALHTAFLALGRI